MSATLTMSNVVKPVLIAHLFLTFCISFLVKIVVTVMGTPWDDLAKNLPVVLYLASGYNLYSTGHGTWRDSAVPGATLYPISTCISGCEI